LLFFDKSITDKSITNSDMDSSNFGMEGSSMRIISRHVLVGGLVAAVLTIGASTGNSGGQVTTATLSPLSRSPAAYVAHALMVCGDKLLDTALDAGGELVGHIKQF
jgi:hypothetical protein